MMQPVYGLVLLYTSVSYGNKVRAGNFIWATLHRITKEQPERALEG